MKSWPIVPLQNAVNDESGGSFKVPHSDYLNDGSHAVIDQGEGLVAGYVNDATRLFRGDLPTIIFGDHTRRLKYVDFPFCIGADGVKTLTPRPGWHPKFVYHYLVSLPIPNAGYSRHYKYLKEFPIIRPPFEEQRKIAEVLDRVDALRVKRKEALALLSDLERAVYLDMFGDPGRNTKRFPTAPLGALGDWKSGGTPPRSDTRYFEGDVDWFSSGELGPLYVSSSREKLSPAALVETSAKSVPAGAVMIGMYDTAALKTSIADVSCSCNQAVAFALLDEGMAHPVFVYYALLVGKEYFRRLQRGVRQKNLNLSIIRGIEIPRPLIAEQIEFAERIRRIEGVKVAQRAHLAELDALFASLQDRAFRGEL
ncbi:restriction endonuclease subunit S [Micromonospora arborensis]|uniref:restriction endonuclease subunit S n=1 Tax=Micromonospora arborensis TaxID=2116518 RepID=UPI0033CF5253